MNPNDLGCNYGKSSHNLNNFLSELMVVKIEVIQIKERGSSKHFQLHKQTLKHCFYKYLSIRESVRKKKRK